MKLSLKNIGKIKEADVEIKGITVIAGENNTGKSTVGKVLFSIFNGLYNIDNQIKKEKIQSVSKIIDNSLWLAVYTDSDEIGEYIVDNIDYFGDFDDESLSDIVIDAFQASGDNVDVEEFSDKFFNQLFSVLKVPEDEILQKMLGDRINYEFNEQINNIYSNEPGEIILTIKNNPVQIRLLNNKIEKIEGVLNLKIEAIYIDDPFIIDESKKISHMNFFDARQHYGHRDDLKIKLNRGTGFKCY